MCYYLKMTIEHYPKSHPKDHCSCQWSRRFERPKRRYSQSVVVPGRCNLLLQKLEEPSVCIKTIVRWSRNLYLTVYRT